MGTAEEPEVTRRERECNEQPTDTSGENVDVYASYRLQRRNRDVQLDQMTDFVQKGLQLCLPPFASYLKGDEGMETVISMLLVLQ
jgi:hypothetical protein